MKTFGSDLSVRWNLTSDTETEDPEFVSQRLGEIQELKSQL